MHRIALGNLTALASSWPLKPHQTTLVFLHGAGFHGGFWQQQSTLAGHFNLIFLNLPGREGALTEQLGIAQYAQEVGHCIKELSSVVLVGHSMGGAVVLQTLLAGHDNIESAVLVSTGARLKVAPAVVDMLREKGGGLIDQFAKASKNISMMDLLLLGQQMVNSEVSIRDFLACNSFDVMERLGEISTPCLVTVGDSDLLTPEKYSQFLEAQLANSSLHVVKGAGHLLPWEATQSFNAVLTEFVKQHEPDTLSTSH